MRRSTRRTGTPRGSRGRTTGTSPGRSLGSRSVRAAGSPAGGDACGDASVTHFGETGRRSPHQHGSTGRGVMATPKDVLDIARSELGITEQPPESNHQKFGQWYGFDGVPWCAEFVSYCFYNAGLALPATTPMGFASAEAGHAWFRSKGWFQSKPAEGDVVF